MSSSYDVMGDFLQHHAYTNVWCTPNQDKQIIFQPARLTKEFGQHLDITVNWRRITLPNKLDRFHVYQIGQIHPLLLGLSQKKGRWIPMAEVCHEESLMIDLYVGNGLQIPRFLAWYHISEDRNVILAIQIPDKTKLPVDLNTQAIFCRLYTNAFYQSERRLTMNPVIWTQGQRVNTTQEILDLQVAYQTYRDKSFGHTSVFINGRFVDRLDLINAQVGDYVEFIYDGSIKKVVRFPIQLLGQFHSDLDAAYKYLLHYNVKADIIEYHDDVDFFLIKRGTINTRFKGVYYHKNNESAVRMVTHQDYSIPTQYLQAYGQAHTFLGNEVLEMELVCHIRHSGYHRPLVYENNRIYDLYQLEDTDIQKAMLGIDSTVSVWQAAALENSDYCKIMRSELGEISRELVQNAYGYHAVSVLLGDTPKKVRDSSGQKVIDVPPGLVEFSTAYEYDSDGYLIGYHDHTGGGICAAQYPNTEMIELFFGNADISWDEHHQANTQPIDPSFHYRCYICPIVGGLPNNEWTDVTDTNQYSIINNQLVWLVNHATTYTLVRSNRNHLVFTNYIWMVDGLMRFSLRQWREDLQDYRVLTIPPETIEVFLNGRSLIEGLDYFVQFPQITVVNKEYLINPEDEAQKLTFRLNGFCPPDLVRINPLETGYIQYGVLSYNGEYNLRDDRVNRIIVDGSLYRFDELSYAESDFTVNILDARNGAPYGIRSITVPMNDYLVSEEGTLIDPTDQLRQKSIQIDREIQDYLTLKLPQKTPVPPSAIEDRYKVFSPFINKIIHDLMSEALWDEQMTVQYSDSWVRAQCQPYEYLLNSDPLKEGQTPSDRFVVIHPHHLDHFLELGIYQYRFLVRVVQLYGRNLIDLANTVRIAAFE